MKSAISITVLSVVAFIVLVTMSTIGSFLGTGLWIVAFGKALEERNKKVAS